MFKILTILTLLYFITSSALNDTEENQPQVLKNSSKIQERETRQVGLCSEQQNLMQNKVLYPLVRLPPVIEPEVVLASNDYSESDIHINDKNLLSLPRNPEETDEIFYENHPDQFHLKPNEEVKENKEEDIRLKINEEKDEQDHHKLDNYNKNNYLYNLETNSDHQLDNLIQYIQDSTPVNQDNNLRENYDSNQNKLYNGFVLNDHENRTLNENVHELELENNEQEPEEADFVENCKSQSGRRANSEKSSPPVALDDNQNTVPATEESSVTQSKYESQRHHRKFGYYNKLLIDPEVGTGVTPMTNGVNLLEHNRVCYACSSASNPTCLQPDRRTTVKYCLRGHEACVTKTFQNGRDKNSLVLIRDCGISCDDTDIPGPQYKSCKVCNSDVCNDDPLNNGAFPVKTQSIAFTLIVIFLIKYTI